MSERTLEPTPRRKQAARAEGRFPRSNDLSGLAVLLAGIYLIVTYGGDVMESVAGLMSAQLGQLSLNVTNLEIESEGHIRRLVASSWLPFAGLMLLFGIISQLGQGGFVWAPARIVPSFSRLKPAGLNTRLASAIALLVKLLAATAMAAVLLRRSILTALGIPSMGELFEPQHAVRSILMAGIYLGAVMFLISAADYAWSLWRYHVSLRMTPEEQREELRGTTGGMRVREVLKAAHDRSSRQTNSKG